jgi:Zn-dependent protease with chaperone function
VTLRDEAVALLILAAALAGPVPSALCRARWPSRNPRTALVLWQAVGLAGGLSLLSAGLTLAAASGMRHWLAGVEALPGAWWRLGLLGSAGAILTLLVGAWLLYVLVTSSTRIVLARRDHRRRLDLVAQTRGDGLEGVHLLEHPRAAAYCLPGLHPRIVVSSGAVAVLARTELQAVLTHERAHAEARHDLVIQPFIAWRETFPFLHSSARALASVELLVEMLADDTARQACGEAAVLGALHHLAGEPLATQSLAAEPPTAPSPPLAARIARLETPARPLPPLAAAAIVAAAALLVVLPPVALLLS